MMSVIVHNASGPKIGASLPRREAGWLRHDRQALVNSECCSFSLKIMAGVPILRIKQSGAAS
jgi:hypothetical protein